MCVGADNKTSLWPGEDQDVRLSFPSNTFAAFTRTSHVSQHALLLHVPEDAVPFEDKYQGLVTVEFHFSTEAESNLLLDI